MIIQESLLPKINLPKRYNPERDTSFFHYFARIHEEIPSVDRYMTEEDISKKVIDFLKLFLDGGAFQLMLTILRDTPAIIDYNRNRRNE